MIGKAIAGDAAVTRAVQVGGLYAGEEVTAVGQHGDWLHVRLYEFDEEEEEEDEDKHGDHDVRHEACNKLTLKTS